MSVLSRIEAPWFSPPHPIFPISWCHWSGFPIEISAVVHGFPIGFLCGFNFPKKSIPMIVFTSGGVQFQIARCKVHVRWNSMYSRGWFKPIQFEGGRIWNLTLFTGWWFRTWNLFFHILGKIIPTDFHIFQRGWNHQSV